MDWDELAESNFELFELANDLATTTGRQHDRMEMPRGKVHTNHNAVLGLILLKRRTQR